jgi:23S rRNA pseudouridine1911/1915/1917 synthase
VRVNGVVVRRGDEEVRPEDRVELGAPSAPFPAALRLVHEDEDLIVIDKPPGLLTIATEHERQRTAYRLLSDYVAAQGKRSARLFIVHRLDRETSGLICFAKSAAAQAALQAQFAARSARRVYVAVVEGEMPGPEGTLSDRLVEDPSLRVRTTKDRRRGREAITRYRVLARNRAATRLELTLVTGRRGQIRAQLARTGHPVLGDRDYGSRSDPLGRLCVHATHLGFRHPRGPTVEFTSPVPPSFLRA